MGRSKSKPLLLIADANPENVSVLKTMLADDFDIKVATDGEETIRLASSADAPGLILLNSIMPNANVAEICRKLKSDKTTKGIPIILLSEPTPDDTEARGFELGAADYITKPFKKSVVNARIRTHLELKRYRDNFETRVERQMSELHEEIQERRDLADTYHALVEHAMDGIVIIHDYKVRFANPAFCKLIGFSEKELKGAHLKKFISEEEFIKNTTRYSSRIAGLNVPRIYKSQVIHSDGSTIDVELNVSVVPYGRTLAALVFVRDISEEEAWKYSI
ncbi:MAG: PAS domain S-box protein [candidate division Zixibacteria bacterium]|nr:PAS domain S-box protein [candidate division Zixibacteria bacterium]NIW43148.1 PAS domain S-box protein [candidate division Zixibacteria bacterium]